MIAEERKTILIVDDEPTNRRLLEALLGREYIVITAEDGREALDQYQTDPNYVNLVISDYMMPKMNGLELYRRIREVNGTPVLFLTGTPEDELLSTVAEDDKAEYLEKPFNINELERTAERLIAGSI